MTSLTRLAPLALLVAGCASQAPWPAETRSDLTRDLDPDVATPDLEALIAGNTAFAADLYRAVRGTPGNLFFSPHSISTALAMTYAGAEGETATQMAETLHFTLPEPALHAALNRLDLELASRALAGTSDVRPFRLHTANSIWGQDGFAIREDFLDTLAVNYGAGLRLLDFAADPTHARTTINTWVEDATEGKIVDLLPDGSITGDTRLVLTNAIYFSAAWETPFEVAQTAPATFAAPGGAITVPTLHQVAELGYGEGEGFRAAELPYDGGQLSMIVVLPDDLAAFEEGLSAARLGEVVASIGDASVTISLPKFDFDAPLSLAETLAALGMPAAFSSAADFSGIDGTRSLAISDVLHKGFVSIDEAGTEAAAATAVVIGDSAVPESHTLVVDRPFVFLIRDRPTGAILFLGRVVDPR